MKVLGCCPLFLLFGCLRRVFEGIYHLTWFFGVGSIFGCLKGGWGVCVGVFFPVEMEVRETFFCRRGRIESGSLCGLFCGCSGFAPVEIEVV